MDMSTERACPTWQDHQWGGARFVESGRHPTMGWYQKYVVRCARCPRETTETRWLTLSALLRREEE